MAGSLGLALAVAVACSSDKEDARPPTPIAWVTPPAPATTEGLPQFSPACDAEMIRVARGEAALEQTLISCATQWEWMGAAQRYPAAVPTGDDGQAMVYLMDLCFHASEALFLRSSGSWVSRRRRGDVCALLPLTARHLKATMAALSRSLFGFEPEAVIR
jgi:hypothetical protein